MINAGAARRYARALFQWAAENDQVTPVQQGLDQVIGTLEALPDLKKALIHPLIPGENKERLIQQAFRGRIPEGLFNFLLLLRKRRRMNLLPVINENFARQALEYRGMVEAQVRAAVALTDDEMERLQRILNSRLSKRAQVNVQIDPELIGGWVVRVGDTVVDGSIKTSLENLRERIAASSRRAV